MRGSVRKRGNTWSIVFDIGQDHYGKRKQKWIGGFRTKKEAQAALAKEIAKVTGGHYMPTGNQTFKEFALEWAKDKQLSVRPGTWRTYESKLNHHILPHIGHIKLKDIRPQHIQGLYNKIRESGRADNRGERVSEHSILHIHRIIHNVFARAVKWGLIMQNPCMFVDKPKPSKVEMKVWTLEQTRIFLREVESEPTYIVFLIALTTGMRIGEVLGLRWQDVNLDTFQFFIQQQIVYVKGGYIFQQVKTKAANRRIPVPQILVAELKKIKHEQTVRQALLGEQYRLDLDLVCCTPFGTPYYRSNLTKKWNKIIAQTGLQRIRIHDARHTHASHLLQQGVNPKVVQERLGHEDISITLNTYSHLLPGLQEDVVSEFERQLFDC